MDSTETTQSAVNPQPTAKPWKPGRGAPPATLARNSTDPEIIARAKRSQVTNGTRVFVEGGVPRGVWARRFRDLYNNHISDLGGPEVASEFQLGLCRRAAALEVQTESFEAQLSEGQEIDLDLYGRLTGHLRRIAETLGLQRVAKDAGAIDLESYSKQMQRGAYRLAADDSADTLPVSIDAAADVRTQRESGDAVPLASSPAANPSRQANTLPARAESPSPPVCEPAAAPKSDHDLNCAPPAVQPPTPAAPPIPTFQRIFAPGYCPPNPQPTPADSVPAGPDAPHKPTPEADGVLPSNRAPR
jgi:hypothetical protein